MRIELDRVSKAYGQGDAQFWALREASLRIASGDFLSIVGPSGSGKSTLLHILGCLDRPTEGSVSIDAEPTNRLSDRQLSRIRRDQIGFVFQQYFLNPSMTALQNVLLPLSLAGVEKGKEKASKALDAVGLSRKLRSTPKEMSGGEQQRVAIARALANDPDLLLADEPTGSLDSKAGRAVLDMLVSLNEERDLGIVVVTHDKTVAKTADTTLHVLDGRIA